MLVTGGIRMATVGFEMATGGMKLGIGDMEMATKGMKLGIGHWGMVTKTLRWEHFQCLIRNHVLTNLYTPVVSTLPGNILYTELLTVG